ncbi:HET-domain-containing protein [Karstenula rhodostoma CBS 690.94]|uniref:HET-domain-containing protein n=1 Tax=Karstenula rhodostoma CBS 690.94 TaxID=1392251 RepID=A0A9P4U9G7_9PLEO|nr:HET-domain-containing protein [Karstenula rhodostoma CBS 690.94]
MHDQAIDISNREPETKHLCEDICEAFQEGIAAWDGRVEGLLRNNERDLEAAKKLRASFEEGFQTLANTYMKFYKQAGAHFAIGDPETKRELASALLQLNSKVIEILQQTPDDALAGVPWVPGSFDERYTIIRYDHLRQHSDYVRTKCVHVLHELFSKISDWAIPVHTLPPLANPTSMPTPPTAEPEPESFFERMRAPFHRQRYEYNRLPTQYSFRLVKVHIARPSVECEMETFSLINPPPFKALSYCWGKGGQHSDIWCNDGLFKVSSNLKKGLQRLHKYGAWSRVEWFWIDQICINQNDIEERMHQVRLMRAIYQRAQNTVIWLGSDDTSARGAISIIGDLYRLMLETQEKETAARVEGRSLDNIQVKIPPEEDERWTSLSWFLDLPWFERCWIIQEVVVSPGDPVLLCGGFQLLWSRFQEAMAALIRYHPRFRAERLKLMKGILDLSSKSEVWELSSLLQSTRPFQATDPRDKVFALLGLAGESRAPDKWPKALLPDYSRMTQDVYMAVTLYCIDKTTSLTILSQAGHVSGTEEATVDGGHRSWVPQWFKTQRGCELSAYTITRSESGWKTLVEKYNNASDSHPVSRNPHTPPHILRLEGVQVANVDSCFTVITPEAVPFSSSAMTLIDSPHPKLLKTTAELFTVCRSHLIHLSNENFLRTFFLVTTAGLTPEQNDARHEPLIHFCAFLGKAFPKTPEAEREGGSMYSLRRAFRSNLSISTLTPSLTPPTSTDSLLAPPLERRKSWSENLLVTPGSEVEGIHVDPSRYTSALAPMLHRRLFVTSTGHLGLGPAGMMSGDVVVVLFGGRVLYVLRRVDDVCWRFLGECYVDGFMYGEAMQPRDGAGGSGEGRVEHEWFDLV